MKYTYQILLEWTTPETQQLSEGMKSSLPFLPASDKPMFSLITKLGTVTGSRRMTHNEMATYRRVVMDTFQKKGINVIKVKLKLRNRKGEP